MSKRTDYSRQLEPLLARASHFEELERVLVANSNLPGPRGNLELAWAFADAVGERGPVSPQWDLLLGWAAISQDEAPTGDPREFLPSCALQGLGSLYVRADPEKQRRILDLLRASANDGRWRIREAVAMAFQRIEESDFSAVKPIFSHWMAGSTLMERRAMVAALAHPPVLQNADNVRFCLQLSERILGDLRSMDRESRKTEGFRVLRVGLEYALSVFVATLPEEGFPLLSRWARAGDPDLLRIVRSNLGKSRLAKKHGRQVEEVLALLGPR